MITTHLLGLLLSGCNLPQGSLPPFQSSQRQTEIAGILNPEGINATEFPNLEITPGTATPSLPPIDVGYLGYLTQQGDTLPALALRFGVAPGDIRAAVPLPENGLLPPGLALQVPEGMDETLPGRLLLPDSEITYGPSVGDFNAAEVARNAGGFLAVYSETVKGKTLSGPEIVQTVAVETSANPRLLLAFLEYRSGWVLGFPEGAIRDPYPIGFGAGADTGLYKELMITAKLLAQGFYGWRDGSRLTVTFSGGSNGRLDPAFNAGSAALAQLFAALDTRAGWEADLIDPESFLTFYSDLFGDPWARAAGVEPYLPADTRQPDLVLPFTPGEAWSLTGGPHITWQTGTPHGAIDFAPVTGEAACAASFRWAKASAAGLVVRSERGVVAVDLDGDGDEGTGWVLVYLHIAEQGRVPVGTWLAQDDPVGHPSCEGGSASGTHVHLARKFNGEWLGVGEPLPFLIGGWQVIAGEKNYQGYLYKGGEVVTASPNGMGGSLIIREE